jgi:hypothetical protein
MGLVSQLRFRFSFIEIYIPCRREAFVSVSISPFDVTASENIIVYTSEFLIQQAGLWKPRILSPLIEKFYGLEYLFLCYILCIAKGVYHYES